MDFEIPADLAAYLAELDEFIEREIRPLEQQDDNIRFFDYRREDARTDWDRGGLPSREWEALLAEAVRRADAGCHRTANKRGQLERRILPHPDRPGLRHDRPLGERRDAQVVVCGLAADPQPARAVGQHSTRRHHFGGDLDLESMVSARRPLAEAAEALADLGSGRVLRQLLICGGPAEAEASGAVGS